MRAFPRFKYRACSLCRNEGRPEAVWGLSSLASEIRFPVRGEGRGQRLGLHATETGLHAGDSRAIGLGYDGHAVVEVHAGLWAWKAEYPILTRPLGRGVAETGNSNPARQAPFDGGFDQIGCEKGERDRHDAGLILSYRPSGLLDRHIRSFHALRPVGEALSPLADLRPASIGLPKNGDDGRVG